MILSQSLHRALRALGFDYERFTPGTHPLARRKLLLQSYGVDLVLDVGANEGQYGRELRALGYTGRIISFEPHAPAYTVLSNNARTDNAWQAYSFALGAAAGTATLQVSANSFSSSLLDTLPAHLDFAPAARQIARQPINVQPLDAVFESISGDAQNVYLKIDTQGYETQVLAGAAQSLARVATIQVEMSLIPLYRDAPIMPELLELVTGLGYELVSLEPGIADANGRLYQVDGIFHRYAGSPGY